MNSMELLASPTSPFVRKCRLVAEETAQAANIKLKFLPITPIEPNELVNTHNPIGKIPVLVLDDGETLYDSRVISEYLDAQHDGKKIFPADDANRWTALRQQSIGDGIMDAGVLLRFDANLRPETYRWPEFAEKQTAKITQSLNQLEAEAAALGQHADIGTIAVACALGYLDFRFTGIIDWRNGRPGIADWFATFSERPSMKATEHQNP